MQSIIINQEPETKIIKPETKIIKRRFNPKHKCYKKNEVLYRITFKYKSNFSGNEEYDVTTKNMHFTNFAAPKRGLRAGDLVKYVPKDKTNHPNYNQLARITRETITQHKEKITSDISFDITFLQPIIVNNKLKTNMVNVSSSSLKLIPEIEEFICEQSFISPIIVNEYIKSRDAYNNKTQGYSRSKLAASEDRLWNEHFVLDDNNEPKYPKWADYGQPLYSYQLPIKQRLDGLITNVVRESFTPARNKIFKRGDKWWVKFVMPEGSNPGDPVSVVVGITKVNVNIPLKLTNNTFPRPNMEIEAEITKENNSASYNDLKKMSTKKINLEFIPTFISAQFSNDTQEDLDKMVKPSKNQTFKITDAKIIKQPNGDNFKFKQLKHFDKQATVFVYDLEVLVDLTLKMRHSLTAEEKEEEAKSSFLKRNTAKGFRNLGLMINNWPRKCQKIMKKIRGDTRKIADKIVSPSSAQIQANNMLKRLASRAKGRVKANAARKRIAKNRSSGRPNVRGGRRRTRKKRGGRRRTQRRKQKKSKKKRTRCKR